MLFDTVDGMDVEPFYRYLLNAGPISESELEQAFVPKQDENTKSTDSTNFKTVRKFLTTAGLIEKGDDGKWVARSINLPFRLALLEQMQAIHNGDYQSEHEFDPVYWELIGKLFIKPEVHYIPDLHTAVASSGTAGINDTKIGTWRKVMQSLSLGRYDKSKGFYFYVPEVLFCEILACWDEEVSDLQTFLEKHMSRFLPFANAKGDLSRLLLSPLESLRQKGIVTLAIKQDSPTRAYTEHRWREIRVNKELLIHV